MDNFAVSQVKSVDNSIDGTFMTKRYYELQPLTRLDPPTEPIVSVDTGESPVQLVFRSHSSPIKVQQVHVPSEPLETQQTSSEDEPQRVLHKVLRPVIQEVREIIQPMRKITQEVRPVLEEINTIISKQANKEEFASTQQSNVPLGSLQYDIKSASSSTPETFARSGSMLDEYESSNHVHRMKRQPVYHRDYYFNNNIRQDPYIMSYDPEPEPMAPQVYLTSPSSYRSSFYRHQPMFGQPIGVWPLIFTNPCFSTVSIECSIRRKLWCLTTLFY